MQGDSVSGDEPRATAPVVDRLEPRASVEDLDPVQVVPWISDCGADHVSLRMACHALASMTVAHF